MNRVCEFNLKDWSSEPTPEISQEYIQKLEQGSVIYLPNLLFEMDSESKRCLTPHVLNKKSKNVSYDILTESLKSYSPNFNAVHALHRLMHRFAQQSQQLVTSLFPKYQPLLTMGRTSFRPADAEGRKVESFRKDDTLLHVDAFPSTPMGGKRILRVFSNVNPEGKPRVWNLGEPFESVATRFLSKIKKPFPFSSKLLQYLKITRGCRTPYDHYMLGLHHAMKEDEKYQTNASQEIFNFQAGSTWVVFTDMASHAALSGQYLLEQTFYIPSHAMFDYQKSPLNILEAQLHENLL